MEPALEITEEEEVKGPWILKFPEGRGVPTEPVQLAQLMDWTRHEDFGIRHFSGTASYQTNLSIGPEALKSSQRILIDLGEVREMAELIVNGHPAGYLWKPPYRSDITSLLNPGENELEVRITNVWANRLIGDAHFQEEMDWNQIRGVSLPGQWPGWLINGDPRPDSDRIAWTTRGRMYTREDPLLPSGLIGPVKLFHATEVK
jgi:hypothetical protein